jgi:hypothetical protein
MTHTPNPLLKLSATQKETLLDLLRAGNDLEIINTYLQDQELPPTSKQEVAEFFQLYSRERWTRRLDLAAQEADTILTLVRQSSGQIPEALLAALGQAAFSKIASGKIEAGELTKYTALFLRAREQDRSERALELQGEKLHLSRRNATEKALDAFARELPQNPAALAAFQQLKTQLLDQTDHLEEPA